MCFISTELLLSLEEHQYALELIMGRYHKEMLQLMMEKKDLDTLPVLSLHEDHAEEVQSQLERICEMGQVMRRAVQIENKELRNLLIISKSSVRPQEDDSSQPATEEEAQP
ncbi:unnamed protein product [Coregonus sp. 'balchen']|nr:unnamed protein product [Coregonus sp. 'balchen']